MIPGEEYNGCNSQQRAAIPPETLFVAGVKCGQVSIQLCLDPVPHSVRWGDGVVIQLAAEIVMVCVILHLPYGNALNVC